MLKKENKKPEIVPGELFEAARKKGTNQFIKPPVSKKEIVAIKGLV